MIIVVTDEAADATTGTINVACGVGAVYCGGGRPADEAADLVRTIDVACGIGVVDCGCFDVVPDEAADTTTGTSDVACGMGVVYCRILRVPNKTTDITT